LESGRKNISEEVQVLIIANAFNEYLLPLVEKECVDDDDGVGSSGHDGSGIGDNNYNNTYTQIYYFLNAFNNSFPNSKLKSSTIQEIKNIMKSLKPKNAYGYDAMPSDLLKISLIYIS